MVLVLFKPLYHLTCTFRSYCRNSALTYSLIHHPHLHLTDFSKQTSSVIMSFLKTPFWRLGIKRDLPALHTTPPCRRSLISHCMFVLAKGTCLQSLDMPCYCTAPLHQSLECPSYFRLCEEHLPSFKIWLRHQLFL